MKNKVFEIIEEIRAAKGLPTIKSINADTKLREDLGFTSFDLAELTVKIEDEFDVDIFEDGLVSTVGEIITKIEK